MNHNLTHLPERPAKPRESGLTMVMDKGLSLRQAEDFLEVNAEKVDLLKLGFGTSIATPNVKEKIKLSVVPTFLIFANGELKCHIEGAKYTDVVKGIDDFIPEGPDD